MTTKKHANRRDFIKTTGKNAAACAALITSAPGILSAKSPNETVNAACIGLGVRGSTLCRQIAAVEGVKVVAVCDVYKPHMQRGVERSDNPEVKTTIDYQEILAMPDVDAVTIATPDHWHSQMLIDASNAGKAIYIEKGWTRTIAEAKEMLAAIKKNKTIMQLGHQAREKAEGIQARQLIEEDVIGPVTLVRTGRFENRPLGKNIWRWYGDYGNYDRPDPAQVIRDLDWDRWLGPLSKRPFSMGHFWHWRCYWDYGTGVAGDLLSHELDFVQYVMRHGIPDTCVCSGLNALLKDDREVPDTWNTTYTFEKANRTVTFDCSMNSNAMPRSQEYYGKEAVLQFNGIAHDIKGFNIFADPSSMKYENEISRGKIKPGKPFRSFDPSKTPKQPYHMQDFINCVRSGETPKCNEDEAFIETATFLMSVAALKENRKVRWDPVKQDIV